MLASILVGVGALITFIFSIILLIQAFKKSVLWGLGYIFVPFVSLIFVCMHWEDTKKPFLISLLGCGIVFIGSLFAQQTTNA